MTSVWNEWKKFGSGKSTEDPAAPNPTGSGASSRSSAAVADNKGAHSNVFVSLPRQRFWPHPPPLSVSALAHVHCQHPAPRPAGAGFEKKLPAAKARKVRSLTNLVSLVVLFSTVFAAYGMLKIMMEGNALPVYYPSAFLKTQSWRGGAGPSPLDAMKNDYQNALTREMVAAADTGAKAAEAKATRKKAPVSSSIVLSGSRYNASLKKGLRNLKLKVFNGTPDMLQRVTVEVDYLGKGGDLLKTETFSTTEVPPHKNKMIDIPEGVPCVKVEYRISEVRTKKHTTLLQHL